MVNPMTHTPRRKSVVEPRLVELGGKLAEQDGWHQAESFASAETEAQAVREGVGLFDLSPLTKIDLRLKDPAAAWPLLFPGEKAPPDSGSLGCERIQRNSIQGRPVLIARTSREHFFLTGLPCTASDMERAIREAASGLAVSVTDVTSCYSAFELSGPAAGSVLQKLTRVASPAKDAIAVQARVAGVHTRILRVDGMIAPDKPSSFPAFRLYVSRDLGLSFWEVLEDAGREFRIQPYGTLARAQLFPDVFPG